MRLRRWEPPAHAVAAISKGENIGGAILYISSIHRLELSVPVVFETLQTFDAFPVELRDVVQRHPSVPLL